MRPLRPHRGFSLLELVLVLALLAIVVAAIAPRLGGWNRGQRLENAADRLLSASRWARSQAISTGTPHRLEIDSLQGSYRVSRLLGESYEPADGEWGRDELLPEGFLIEIRRQDESGAALIELYPNGRVTPATVVLTAEWGESVTLASTAAAESLRRVSPDGGL